MLEFCEQGSLASRLYSTSGGGPEEAQLVPRPLQERDPLLADLVSTCLGRFRGWFGGVEC